MQITDFEIRNTLLEILARKGVAAGDLVWISRLEQFWNETRLRRYDLLNGIARLCSAVLLDLEQAGASTANEILASGVNYCGRYLRNELLPAVRQRDDPPQANGRGRRDYEVEFIPETSAKRS